MAKQKKIAIKTVITINEKGELEVDSNISPLGTVSILSDAIGMISRDVLTQQRAESVQPETPTIVQ